MLPAQPSSSSGLAVFDTGCVSVGPAAVVDEALHARRADLLRRYDVNDFATREKVYAVEPRRDPLEAHGEPVPRPSDGPFDAGDGVPDNRAIPDRNPELYTKRSPSAMARRPLLIPVLVLALISGRTALADDEGWVPLFDGKTLDGWKVNGGTASYKVEDGAIVGTTVEGSPNTFLCKGDFKDFVLELEVKCDPAG